MKKNMSRKSYIWILMLSCLFVGSSCDDKDTYSSVKGDPLLLTASIQMMEADNSDKFNGGESVGLWVSSLASHSLGQADVAQNLKFYQSAAGLVSEPRTYWGNHQELHIYGYYPYDSEATASPESYLFSVKNDQRTPEEMVASDLLWTQKTVALKDGKEKTQLDFSHLMSKIMIHVRGSHPDAGSLRECGARLTNVISDALVNLKEGSVSPADTRSDIDAMPLATVADNYETSLQVIVVPQTFSAGTPLLKAITKGNVENEWAPEQDITLNGGMQLVLDVMIEETECIVTIQDISPWEVDSETLKAEAIEQLPSYELYDFYSRFGVEGIVIALDEGSNGQHGWVISTDETELIFSPQDLTKVTGFSRTDAILNLKLALQEDPTLEKFPAIKWCDDKNAKRTTVEDLEQNGIDGRWILLPVSTLKTLFGDKFLAYGKTANLDRLNTAIENSSVASSSKVKVNTVNWSDPLFMMDYWSSTHISKQNLANILRCATNDHTFFGGTGVFTSTSDISLYCKVRAFCHF